jgi:hypothetical protein
MGSPLDAGNELAAGALVAITAAACVIPDAWPIAGEAYKLQCDPGAMFESGQAWLDSAAKIGEALQAAIDVNNSLGGTGWEGADYTAFTEKTADYIRQMMVAQVFAYTVGIAIIVAAIASFIAIVVLTVMGAVLAIFAACILAAMASVVGFLGPVEALELDASLFAVECEIGLRELDVVTKTTDAVLAGGIGAFLAGDIGIQLAMGNGDVLGDLAQGTVGGLGTITTGLMARVYRDAMGKGIGSNIGRGPLQTVLTGLGLNDVLGGSGTLLDGAASPFDSAH